MDATNMFSDEYLSTRKVEVSRKLQEFAVLESELQTLKKDSKLYIQQPNSNIFFLEENKDKVLPMCKDSIVKLKEEQKKMENMKKPLPS